ncbi:MAG: hypothetical protein AB7O57_13140 [Hyphomicrobiaceae bacterium]
MRPWQVLALVSGSIVTAVMALASVSYAATLGTAEPAFVWLPIPNSVVFAVLALAFDLGMIASLFGVTHWWSARRVAALTCVVLFVIASAFSIHAVRGYIALNVTKAAAPAARAQDVYASLKLELEQAQVHLGDLQTLLTTAARRERGRLEAQISAARARVHEARSRLAQAEVPVHVSPLSGLEWGLALMLWVFNATCWTAWFGPAAPPRTRREQDTVAGWLGAHQSDGPEHCAALFAAYSAWCRAQARKPLAPMTFYARLIELGAEKFRDGRNGPTLYKLPSTPMVD